MEILVENVRDRDRKLQRTLLTINKAKRISTKPCERKNESVKEAPEIRAKVQSEVFKDVVELVKTAVRIDVIHV